MRRHKHIVVLGPGGKFLGLQNTAKVGNIGLEVVGGLEFDDLAEVKARMDALARGHRDINLFSRLLQSRGVLGWYWLLNPRWLKALQLAGDGDGGGGIEASMHLDQNLYLGTHGITHGLNQGERAQALLALQFIEARAKGIKF